jgi:hypothetical protein
MTTSELLHSIKPGDKVTILVHAGIGRNGPESKPRTGRAVMFNRVHDSWVLNMGGRYGTPGIAQVCNLVSVRKWGKR